MTTYTWSVNNMFTVNTPNPDYVTNVIWTLTGVDGQATAYIGGNTRFDSSVQPASFIPYDQLTQEIVLGWVQDALGEQGISNYQDCVQGQIDSILNPPVSPQNTPLPWATLIAPAAPIMNELQP
jgi:hypothetical protein